MYKMGKNRRRNSLRVLFIADYADPLISILPLVRAARQRGHLADILCMLRVENDRERVPKILSEHGGTAGCIEMPDASYSGLLGYLFSKFPRIYGILASALYRRRVRNLAVKHLKRLRPDVMVVTNEHLPLLRYFIDVATRRGIPSICYLHFSGAFSARKLREQLKRFDYAKPQAEPERAPRQGLIASLRRLAWKLIQQGLSIYRSLYHLDIVLPSPYWGGGNATYLSVIGKGSRDTMVELGVNPEKIRITGYQIYEDMYHRGKRKTGENYTLRRQLGLPLDKPLFLWCTNDQPTYYQRYFTYEQMLESWKAIRDVLLRVNPDWHLVIKLHPKESKDDYLPVVSGEPRVTLIEDCDVWELIAESDFFLTRFSSTASSALCLGKPTLTHNYPAVPSGVLFDDIVGTLHANTLEELEANARGLVRDSAVQSEAARRREEFIRRQIDIQERSASDRFIDLVEEVATRKIRRQKLG
jgi:hypothetical protein